MDDRTFSQSIHDQSEAPASKKTRSFSLRALALGVILIPVSIYWLHQLEIVWYTAEPTAISLYFHVVFIFLLLMGGNRLVRRLQPSWALTQNELLIVYIMLVLANSIAGHDQFEILVCMLGGSAWFATPENRWTDIFGNALPDWLVVKDKNALHGFYMGESSFSRSDFSAWLNPLAFWGGFTLVLFMVTLAINVILRKQWSDRERLSYPIAQIPIEMSQPGFFTWKNRLFWIAFGAMLALDTYNALASLYPSLPTLQTRAKWNIFATWPLSSMGYITTAFYPFAIGLGYFLPNDLLFSLWFFFWFWKAQALATGILGFGQGTNFPYVQEQSVGGYLGICLFTLYTARHHLKVIMREAIFGSRSRDRASELMSYRLACIIALLGFFMLVGFAIAARVSLMLSVIFFVIYLGMSLAVTRMRAQVGPPAHDMAYGGPNYMLPRIFGSSAFNTSALSFFALTWWMNRAFRSQPMPPQIEGIRIGEKQQLSNRLLLFAMILACIVGITASYWSMLSTGYQYGMTSSKIGFAALVFSSEPYDILGSWINTQSSADIGAGIALGIGIVFTIILLFLRSTLVRFPLHPIGYAASSSWSGHCLWMPLLISWIIKSLIMRYGGLKLYRQAMPLFVGLILGEFCAGSVWSLVGVFLQKPVWIFWP